MKLRLSLWLTCLLVLAPGARCVAAEDTDFVFVGDVSADAEVQAGSESNRAVLIVDEAVAPTKRTLNSSLSLKSKRAPSSLPSHSVNQESLRADSSSTLSIDQIPDPFPGANERAPTKSIVSRPAELGDVEQLLVVAHTLSQQCKTETDYSELIESCTTALQQGARGQNKQFALQLISWALNRRGQLYANSDKGALATADFQEAVHFDANNWRALHNRGVSFAEAGQFAEAFDDFNRVIELNPKFAKAYTNRGTLYVQAGDLASAEEDYLRACRLDAKQVSARLGLARVCHSAGRYDDSLEHFTIATQLDPKNPDTLCSRGDLLADMGRYAEALVDYAQAIEVDSDFAHAYRNGAWLLATCPDEQYRDEENAIRGARQALQYEYGERYVALDTLAAALANAGQFDKAIATLEEALEIAPSILREEYVARIKLYEAGQPFRTRPVAQAGD